MSSSPQRWFGVGQSTAADPARAGADAAQAALLGRTPELLIVFASLPYSVPAMADAVHAAAGGLVPLVGCSTSGEFSQGGRGAGVVVVALGGSGFEVAVRAVAEGSLELREAGASVASGLDDVDREHRVLLLLADGRSSDQQEVVRGAYTVTGASVPLVGGCAGDGVTQTSTRAFFSPGGGEGVTVLTNGVVAAAIGSDAPFGVGIAHGWRKSGEPMVVTKSQAGKIYELDGERALDVYLRRTGAAPDLAEDPAAFFAFAPVHPLGLSRRTGEDLRVIFEADPVEGSISGLADTPEGALAWCMEGDPGSLLEATADASCRAADALGGVAPLGVVVFDCCVRPMALGESDTDAAAAHLAKTLGPVAFGGFYSNGEIARTSGAKGMHHLTVVALAVS